MGSAKIPEEIEERRDDGLLHANADVDPVIKAALAIRPSYTVKPEERNRRRKLSLGAQKGTITIYKKMALKAQLQNLFFRLDAMQGDPVFRDMSQADRLKAQLILKQQIRELRSKLGGRRR